MPDGVLINLIEPSGPTEKAVRRSRKRQPVTALVAEFFEAEREWLAAAQAVEDEDVRVRALQPVCPDTIWVATTCRKYPEYVREQVLDAIARGTIRGPEAREILNAYETWAAECASVTAQHYDTRLQVREKELDERWKALEQRVIEADASSTADVRAKLRFIAHTYAEVTISTDCALTLLTTLARAVSPELELIELNAKDRRNA